MVVPSYHYMIGPAAAFFALAVILLICKWVFSTTTREQRLEKRRAALLSRGDYGLLVPVATTRTAEDAAMLRDLLKEAGVRCTVTDGDPGTWQLLVFRSDADRASALVRS